MENGKQYKISAKNAVGSWRTYGNLKKSKFDKWQIGMKVTEELKQMILANEGKWINFALFEDNQTPAPAASTPLASVDLSDEIPF